MKPSTIMEPLNGDQPSQLIAGKGKILDDIIKPVSQ